MRVLFVGSDIKIRCETCGHDVITPRVKLEKNIKQVIENNGNEKNEWTKWDFFR